MNVAIGDGHVFKRSVGVFERAEQTCIAAQGDAIVLRIDQAVANDHVTAGVNVNAIAVADALEKHGMDARVLSAVEMNKFCEYFTRDTADRYLNEGKVVIFAAGTGNPYFSTDTGAVLRGVEIEADAILMAKNVDGIYSADPNVDPTAVKFDKLTYDEVLARHLKATDTTAMTLAMDNHMTLVCFALKDPENIYRVVCGEAIGTTVKED